MVTESGYGKRSALDEYRIQSRGGVGIITQKTSDKVGNVVATKKVRDDQELILSTDKGQNIRMRVAEISILGRNTQGVRLINLSEKEEKVTGLAVVDGEEDLVGSADESGTPPLQLVVVLVFTLLKKRKRELFCSSLFYCLN